MPATTSPTSATPRYAGLGDGFSKAFELAFTPAIFAGLGYLADRALGTSPVAMIAFTVFAVVGMFVRTWYRYNETMAQEQARTVAARSSADAAAAQRVDRDRFAYDIAGDVLGDDVSTQPVAS